MQSIQITCTVQDEVLAHRLGLIPLDADPTLFEYKTSKSADFVLEPVTSEKVSSLFSCIADLADCCRGRNRQ